MTRLSYFIRHHFLSSFIAIDFVLLTFSYSTHPFRIKIIPIVKLGC